MAAFQENIRAAEQSLAVAQKLLNENKIKEATGTMSQLDVVTAESEVAARQRDLVVARTNLQLQEARVKNVLSKKIDSELSTVRVVTTDSLPDVKGGDVPDLEQALASAYENRPELKQSQTNVLNQNIAGRFTQNTLRPNLALFGLYAGSGLEGNSLTSSSGASDSLAQAFGGDFPEQAGGISLSIPIKNRAAQADDLRAQLELSQLQVSTQRLRNQIVTEVQQGVVGLVQGKAQEEAALEAVRLGQKTLEAEQYKLEQGVSTSYNVILRERDLLAAQLAEVQARAAYAKAVVEMDRATGTTLDRNGIQLSDAVNGTVTSMPVPSFKLATPRPGGRP
jgi:outer membrane protein TolC